MQIANEINLKEKQHIQSFLVKQSNQDKIEYQVQLNAIVNCIRFLLCWGLAFHDHDESQGSSDKGNFLELLQFLGDHNESINEVLQKVSKNCKLTHHEIQKDIVNAVSCETSKAIIKDLDKWVLFNISWWVTCYLSERANGPHYSLCE